VITAPALDAQRQATKDAGDCRTRSAAHHQQPTAAARLQLDKINQNGFWCSTWEAEHLMYPFCSLGERVFEVKATAGNNHLGGDDFDNCIVWMISLPRTRKIDLS